jgi:SNF family Na+-dependent transporter
MEVILFMWIFTPSKAWESMHQGADLRIPQVFKFIMTYVTPVYLLFILGWWGYVDALPILMYEKSAGGGSLDPANTSYVTISRAIIVLFAIVSVVLIRMAWKRNKYDDRKGFVEVDRSGEGA